jgi:hypothetical protein
MPTEAQTVAGCVKQTWPDEAAKEEKGKKKRSKGIVATFRSGAPDFFLLCHRFHSSRQIVLAISKPDPALGPEMLR